MSGYVISNSLEADGETLLDEVEKDLNLDTTKFVTIEEIDQTVKGHKEFTQPLVVADPTLSTHATNKQYVENYVNSHTGGGGTNAHFQTILTKDIRINTTQQTGEGRVLFTRGENGETIEASIMMDSDGGLAINANTKPLDLAGSKIINIADGDEDYDAVTKRQLTNGLNSKLNLSGGTISGGLTIDGVATIKGGKSNAMTIEDLYNSSTNENNEFRFTIGRPSYTFYTGGTRLCAKISNDKNAFYRDLDMSGNKIENVDNGTNPNDAVNKSQLDTKLNVSGGSLTGDLNMTTHNITNVFRLRFAIGGGATRHLSFGDRDKLTIGSYTTDTSQTTEPYIHLNSKFNQGIQYKLIELMKDINCHGTIKMLDNKTITNVPNPHNAQDVANKAYVDSKASNSPISLVDGRALLDASGGLYVYGGGGGEDGLITTEGDLKIKSGDAIGLTDIIIESTNLISLNAPNGINVSNSKVFGVPEPTQPNEVATKNYVDNAVSSTSQLMAYSNVRFKMNSYTWKSSKFTVPSNVISGKFVFTANLSIWNSNYTYASLFMKNHTAYVEYRLCDKNGIQIGLDVGKIYQRFGSYASNQYVPRPMNTTNTNFYYSNANVNFTYARVIAPYDEVQFQYRWREIIQGETGSATVIKPEDGFVDARVQLNILPI